MALYRNIHRSVPAVLRRLGVRISCSGPAVLVCLAASCLTLSACSSAPGDAARSEAPSPPPPASSSPAPDPRPTAASSNGPARNTPRPELPEAAKKNTKEGFAAFTQYWFDTITYGLETGDSGPLRAASTAGCKMCGSYLTSIEEAANSGGWREAPRWTVSGFSSDFVKDANGRVEGVFILDESASVVYSAQGVIERRRQAGRLPGAQAIHAAFVGGNWTTAEAGGAESDFA